MSSTTLNNIDNLKLPEREGPLSDAPTPARNSLETAHDAEKLSEPEQDGPPPLSRTRKSLLIMGLTLSIFLVALDFV